MKGESSQGLCVLGRSLVMVCWVGRWGLGMATCTVIAQAKAKGKLS